MGILKKVLIVAASVAMFAGCMNTAGEDGGERAGKRSVERGEKEMFQKRGKERGLGNIGEKIEIAQKEFGLSDAQTREFAKLGLNTHSEVKNLVLDALEGKAEKADFEKMFDGKVEEVKKILDEEQFKKLESWFKLKIIKFNVMNHVEKGFKIKEEIIKELNLTEEQKTKIIAVLRENMTGNSIPDREKIKTEIGNILTEEQKTKAEKLENKYSPVHKIHKELKLTEEQKKLLRDKHQEIIQIRKETIEKYAKGEIGIEEIKQKDEEIKKIMESVLTKEQIEKIEKGHKKRMCERRKHFKKLEKSR